jgi:xanthine/CO dehydrogenase XdhC/CoxF family maturation factor
MTDLEPILPLWRELHASGVEYVLATVVHVDGSGYRKPGARMLVAADGRRAGTISGGCLEGEVARKAFWRTEHGPVVRRYSTTADDGDVPYGMGCGGVVHLLLERSATAAPLLERLAMAFAERRPLAVATVLDGPRIGMRAFFPAEPSPELTRQDSKRDGEKSFLAALAGLALDCFGEQRSFVESVQVAGEAGVKVGLEWCAARPGLFVFGAGDDAIPLVKMARQLGWYVRVADGRANLPTRSRFPEADALGVIELETAATSMDLRATDAAVLMTHSLQQDAHVLSSLLQGWRGYLGVLGPRHRTHELLLMIAENRAVAPEQVDRTIEEWMDRLHAPIGLDLGGDAPADIALAVIAEVQQWLHQSSGISLRRVRNRASEGRVGTASVA